MYAELDDRARRIAGLLRKHAQPGTRACLFYPPGLDYVAALFGCLYAGVVAVPGYPPRSRRRLQRLEALIEDPGSVVALTTGATLSLLQPALQNAPEAFRDLRWLTTDELDESAGGFAGSPDTDPDSTAIVQYTSGSTANARGVMLSHANLLWNMEQIGQRFGLDDANAVVSWLPPYHDMGLIGCVLTPVYTGVQGILMSPAAFIQRPSLWLDAISRHRAAVAGAPNFAYDLCVRKVSEEDRAGLDLSSWRVAFNGAEPIHAETLERFADRFGPCGFRRTAFEPCYGLAEATLMVTSGDWFADPVVRDLEADAIGRNQAVPYSGIGKSVVLVGSGHAIEGTEIRIVDPTTLRDCPPGGIGEILVAGPSVAGGYWNRPEETEAAFRAGPAGSEGEGKRYLRTGDLGFLDGPELFVTGRLKDLIIIKGVNFNAQAIEAAAEASHEALRPGCCAAFGIDDEAGTGHLVVVQEVELRTEFSASDAIAAMRAAIAEAHGIETGAVVLIQAGTIPKTSSGKIRRAACRALYLEGKLDTVADWSAPAAEPEPRKSEAISEADARQWLTTRIARLLNLSESAVDATRPFSEYGLESSDAVTLVLELEGRLGRPVSPTVVWDYPSIDALAAHLAQGVDETAAIASPSATNEAIAVVGLACRFPGAPDAEAFRRLLWEGRSAIREVPAGRWGNGAARDGVARDDPARWGGFLDNVDQFDAAFFGISPREAVCMDPQQRLLLEVAWEALEDGGIAAPKLAGTRAGVFIGISNADYSREQTRGGDDAGAPDGALDIYSGTGNAFSIAANRLSYALDLRGPSLAVDTACSSSLAAIHLACQSLRLGESSLALAGGVNLMLSPEPSVVFSQARMLAPDGRCKVFDASANGYVRGEGCGVVVLKRLSDALRDGDAIAGTILATSVNQDGRTNGITAPNGPSQQAVLRDAMAKAGVEPSQVGYVETHGTGTPLGDPIEVQSLGAVFGQAEAFIGSLKANIGHLESAAGIASIVKALLILKHGEIPPQINLRALNPHLGLGRTRLTIPLERRSWPGSEVPRLVAVNSFGFGGTNAAAIVSEPPPAPAAISESGAERGDAWHLFRISARSDRALRELAGRYAEIHAPLGNLCFSAATGRAHFAHRFAAVVSSSDELILSLIDFAQGGPVPPAAPDSRLAKLRDRYLAGGEVDVDESYRDGKYRRVALPTYPFERESYWIARPAKPAGAGTGAEEDEPTRPLIGKRLESALPIFEKALSVETSPFLQDHVLNGQTVVPAAALIEMALEAVFEDGGEDSGAGCVELSDIVFSRALTLPQSGARSVQVVLKDGFEIFSRPMAAGASRAWVSHARGGLRPIERDRTRSLDYARERCRMPVDPEVWYAESRRRGLDYGERFRGLRQAWKGAGEAVGYVEIHRSLEPVVGDFALHPAFVDSCLHVLGAIGEIPGVWLPVGLDAFRCYGEPVARGWVHAVAGPVTEAAARGDVHVFDTNGKLVFEALGLSLIRVDSRDTVGELPDGCVFELKWEPAGHTETWDGLRGAWAVVSRDAMGDELAGSMRRAGASCEVLKPGESIPTALAGVVFLAHETPTPEASEAVCVDALETIQALAQIGGSPRLWLVEHAATPSALSGLGSVAALEYPALRCTRIAMSGTAGPEALVREFRESSAEDRILLRDGERLVARLTPSPRAGAGPAVPQAGAWQLESKTPGDLDSLVFSPCPRPALGPTEIEIEVRAAGLNFSDVMKAMGLYPGATAANMVLGAECAGRIARVGSSVTRFAPGDEAMAVAPHAFAPWTRTDASLAIRTPAGLRPEEAATIPVAFLTAAYALNRLARLQSGERILIHAGTGGVGLAAIQIAKLAGTEIFATAGSAEKRAYLETLGLAGVFDSRSLDFAGQIQERTNGYGVDVALNSLAGEGMLRTLDLVAPHGRFLEIGKSDIYRNARVGLKPFQRAISYFAIDLDRMFRERRAEIQSILSELATQFAAGELKPLPVRVFAVEETPEAFRHMAQAKHIGRIAIGPIAESKPLLRADATYLVTGGLGALGLHVTRWLAGAGARHIVLVSRMPRHEPPRIEGVEIVVRQADVSGRDEVAALLEGIAEMPPLRGVFHAAGALADATLARMDAEGFHAAFAAKACGAWHLHELTAGIPLDFFVLFSSLAGVMGSPGQGNYAAANAFLDWLAHRRIAMGLPALAIDWGPWAGGGMAAGRRAVPGISDLDPARAIGEMEDAIRRGRSGQTVVAAADWAQLARAAGNAIPLLSGFGASAAGPEDAPGSGPAPALTRQSLAAAPPGERRPMLELHIREQIARVAGIPAGRVDPLQGLGDLGIDSLTSLELITRLEQTLKVSVPMAIMTSDLNVATLAEHLAERLAAE